MKKVILAIAILSLVGCATVPGPAQMRNQWQGGDDATFVKVYAECRMKADEKAGGIGTTAMTILIWPVGLAMGITGAMDAANTMKLCMAGSNWEPVKK